MSLSSKGYTSSFRGSVPPGAYIHLGSSDFSSLPAGPAELGAAGAYELLAYSGISNTGSSVISGGNIGSFPTASITGFPPGIIVPPAGIDNAAANAARIAGEAAFTYYTGLVFTTLASGNLSTSGTGGTNVYVPGNYFYATGMTMPTGIVLNGPGLYIFWGGSTVNLASGQSVVLENGATADNVIWCVGSSFTSVATSNMVGNILAYASVTLGGGTLVGRALAVGGGNGAVSISAATVVTSPSGLAVAGSQNLLPLIAPESTADYIFVIPNTGAQWKVQKSVNFARPNGTADPSGILLDTLDCIQPEYPGISSVVAASNLPASYFVMNGYGFKATGGGTTAATFIGFANFNTVKGAVTVDGSVSWTSLGKVALIRARFANLSAVSALSPVAQEYDFWEN